MRTRDRKRLAGAANRVRAGSPSEKRKHAVASSAVLARPEPVELLDEPRRAEHPATGRSSLAPRDPDALAKYVDVVERQRDDLAMRMPVCSHTRSGKR